MCISRCGAAEVQVDFSEGRQFIETQRFAYDALRSATKRARKPSLGVIVPTHPHERNFVAPKFEDPNQEYTLEKTENGSR